MQYRKGIPKFLLPGLSFCTVNAQVMVWLGNLERVQRAFTMKRRLWYSVCQLTSSYITALRFSLQSAFDYCHRHLTPMWRCTQASCGHSSRRTDRPISSADWMIDLSLSLAAIRIGRLICVTSYHTTIYGNDYLAMIPSSHHSSFTQQKVLRHRR